MAVVHQPSNLFVIVRTSTRESVDSFVIDVVSLDSTDRPIYDECSIVRWFVRLRREDEEETIPAGKRFKRFSAVSE